MRDGRSGSPAWRECLCLPWLPVLPNFPTDAMPCSGTPPGSHLVNDRSSRSHLVVTVTAKVRHVDGAVTRAKLNLVDLAGMLTPVVVMIVADVLACHGMTTPTSMYFCAAQGQSGCPRPRSLATP